MFDLIYIDPPWAYNSRACHSKTRFGGGVSRQYPVMQTDELLALGPLIQRIAADKCVMACWYTAPHLETMVSFIKACGFTYKTKAFTWIKINKDGTPFAGPGFYTASNSEDVALCVRTGKGGSAPRPAVNMMNQVVLSGRREHSRKPDDVAQRLELLYPSARKLEVFCRFPRDNWTCIGNEVDGLDVREALMGLLVDSGVPI